MFLSSCGAGWQQSFDEAGELTADAVAACPPGRLRRAVRSLA
ncbi:hypothetical protein ACU4GD_21060 [Cupriavidus basilensis]